MSQMRAAAFRQFGPPSVLKEEPDFPRPQRRRSEVLIRVACASINPIDWKTRKGEVPRFMVTRPKIPGGDVSGVVVEAEQGSKFKVGDRVFGCIGTQIFWSTYGTYAEYAVAAEDTLETIPEGVTYQAAAAVPLAAMTAWQALQLRMPLAGKRVLVHAGAGGVGGFAVQIAKAQGAFVATTCSTRNVEYVTKVLGADQAIDYTKEKFEVVSSGPYDLVVDLMGGSYEERSLPLVAQGGHYTSVLNSGYMHEQGMLKGALLFTLQSLRHSLSSLVRLGPSYSILVMQHQAAKGLTQLRELLVAGKLKVEVAKVFPLAQAAEAHALSEEGHVRGKIVLQVADEASLAAAQ